CPSVITTLSLPDALPICAYCHEFASSIARFWTEIDDPISALDHLQVVLDHHDRMSTIDQPLKQLQQHRHVIEMQSGGRLIEDERSEEHTSELQSRVDLVC